LKTNKMFKRTVFFILLITASLTHSFFTHTSYTKRVRIHQLRAEGKEFSAEETKRAMEAARACAQKGLSPGAGLATAEEQAEAAYADLINTSIDQRGIDLSENELKDLNRGGKMWEKGSTTRKNKFGLFSDLANAFEALAGGAHIEKNEFGET
jgi:hypothetical protein